MQGMMTVINPAKKIADTAERARAELSQRLMFLASGFLKLLGLNIETAISAAPVATAKVSPIDWLGNRSSKLRVKPPVIAPASVYDESLPRLYNIVLCQGLSALNPMKHVASGPHIMPQCGEAVMLYVRTNRNPLTARGVNPSGMAGI